MLTEQCDGVRICTHFCLTSQLYQQSKYVLIIRLLAATLSSVFTRQERPELFASCGQVYRLYMQVAAESFVEQGRGTFGQTSAIPVQPSRSVGVDSMPCGVLVLVVPIVFYFLSLCVTMSVHDPRIM